MKYTLQRLMNGLIVLFIISLITYWVLMVIPGDPALLILGTDATPEAVERLREAMGLNLPWYERYWHWLSHFLAGDWGTSQVFGTEVRTLIFQRLPVTISLALLSMAIAVPIAALFGILSAIKKNTWVDYVARTAMQLGEAIPQFWLAILFLIVFAAKLRLFPITGGISMEGGFVPGIWSILLPAVVISIGLIGILIRIIRSSMLSALEQDFMLMTRVNGLPPRLAILKYALRGAYIAPLTNIALQLAGLLGGRLWLKAFFLFRGWAGFCWSLSNSGTLSWFREL